MIARRSDKPTSTDEALSRIAAARRIPRATYRLQLSKDFDFRDAAAVVPYLDELGISDVYASPIFKARPGSEHGYDVCDHTQINPELGGEKAFDALVSVLQKHGMGLIVDMVPNHMAINHPYNRWWTDVLENGQASAYASFFDVDWHPVKAELAGKILLPILGDQYGVILERGELKLAYGDGAFSIRYWEKELPVAPCTYERILSRHLSDVVEKLGDEDPDAQELQSILTAIRYLPPRTALAPHEVAERHREKEVVKRRIAALYENSRVARDAIEASVDDYNSGPQDPRGTDLLDDLLSDQAHRLAYWRVAAEEINYRRFFDVNDMAAIRPELPEVFDATHDLLLRLTAEGKVTGIRVDHPDGLWAPTSYFRWLQEGYIARRLGSEGSVAEAPSPLPLPLRQERGKDSEDATTAPSPQPSPRGRGGSPTADEAARAWFTSEMARAAGTRQWPVYVVAEKILAHGEGLPTDWAVDGTTGYDYLASLNGIFVDRAAEDRVDRIYRQFTGVQAPFWNLTNSTKKMIMLVSLSSEINALSHQLERISEKNRLYRDFTLNSLTFAIREVMACLPVYRTYCDSLEGQSPSDEAHIKTATAEARRRNPRTAGAVFDFIEDMLLLRNLESFREEDYQSILDFVMKFQQVSGPVMAKGVEDTAFYVFTRLASLNEVGGDPAEFGTTIGEFHQQNTQRLRRWPHAMLATSTHDTKRSEDVRARISVVSEVPTEWRDALARWSRINVPKKRLVDGARAPDANDEYLLYQTLIGAWPVERVKGAQLDELRERVVNYMLKATKEAKVHTSWVNPNDQYDAAVEEFVRNILVDDPEDEFLTDLAGFRQKVARLGAFNGLSQMLLKLTSPGVPDLYQGTELWSLSLVDPDNRRPVDYTLRKRLLTKLGAAVREAGDDRSAYARSLLETVDEGRAKLYVTQQTLECRRANEELFSNGAYVPIQARGPRRRQICSFARVLGNQSFVVVAPRLLASVTGGGEQLPLREVWEGTTLLLPSSLTAKSYRDAFTGQRIRVEAHGQAASLPIERVLSDFPVALLEASSR